MEEIKETTADVTLEIWTDCPYCGYFQDVSDLKEHLEDDLRADHIEEEITCENKDCGKRFIINQINY